MILGMRELIGKLRMMPRVTRTAARRALRRGAGAIAAEARARAPHRTGVGATGIEARGTTVVSTEPYMVQQELGTEHMAAQPHLRPAVESLADRVVGDVRNEVRGALPR